MGGVEDCDTTHTHVCLCVCVCARARVWEGSSEEGVKDAFQVIVQIIVSFPASGLVFKVGFRV